MVSYIKNITHAQRMMVTIQIIQPKVGLMACFPLLQLCLMLGIISFVDSKGESIGLSVVSGDVVFFFRYEVFPLVSFARFSQPL